MLFITDNEFERVVSRSRNRQLARQYYEEEAVERIIIEERSYGYEVVAKVNVYNQVYIVRLYINHDSKITSHECDCIYSDEYTACAHIGAVILKIQELAPDHFPYYFNSDYVNQKTIKKRNEDYRAHLRSQWERQRRQSYEYITSELTDDIRSGMLTSFAKRDHSPVELLVVVDSGYEQFRFRIGRDKFYYVKNPATLIQRVEKEEYHSYGKNFAWHHNYDEFSEPAKKIYDFILKQESLYGDSNSYYYGITSKQYFPIDNDNIDAFVKLIDELPDDHVNTEIREEPYTANIKVEKDDLDYILTLTDSHNFLYGKNNLYEINNNYIRVIEGDSQGIFSKLMRTFDYNKDVLYINPDKMDSFNRYLLAPISDYINLTGLEETFSQKEEDLIEIYGDIDEDEVAIFEVMGIYGEDKINMMLDTNHPHSITVDMVIEYIKNYTKDIFEGRFYLDTHLEETMDFLNEGIHFLNDYADIYISDTLKKIGTRVKMRVNVGITVKNDLLSIDIDSLDIPKEELAQVMSSYRKKKKYHKLKNGEMLYIKSDELAELASMMDHYHLMSRDMKNGHIDMNLNRAYAMNMSADSFSHVTVDRSEAFKDVIHRLEDYTSHDYPLNDQYKDILRDYQKDGYQWLSTMNDLHFGGILADDMGLGKTLQMIAFLEAQKKHFTIVVCPSSLILNWKDEFEKFSSRLKVVCVMGSIPVRKDIIGQAKDYDVLITSYDYMRRDVELYSKYKFDYIILDEAQYIKNQNTKNAMSVKRLKGKHHFALTGTPIENSLAELWSIFDFLNKDYLFNYHYFKKQYESPIVRNHDEKKQKELKSLISPFVLRRRKSEVLKELPEKIEKTITIDFKEDERKLYYAHLAAANKQLQTLDSQTDRIQILAMLTRLRQICCEPRLLFDDVNHVSSKMEACLDIIDVYKENDQKLILFSSFATVLDLLSKELKKRKISYYKLTGATNKTKRKDMVDRFQQDDTTVFLISLKAGGTGLNLTAAEGVIHYDPWWNMSAQNQATDRAHRIGQENVVSVYKLIMRDSIEEKIQKLQEAKMNLADTFVEGNDGSITSMTSEEIMSLFK